MTFRLAFALLACMLGTAAQAQLEAIDAPVSFTATPAIAVPGTAVLLKGSTPFVTGQPGEVSLQISPPAADGGDADGTPVTLIAALDKDGNYSLSYTDTQVMGEYRVLVTAPDGKGSTTGKFAVLLLSGDKAAEQVTGTVWAGYKAVFQASETALLGAEQIINSLPASPEKAETLKRLAPAKKELERLQQQTAAGTLLLGTFVQTAVDYGGGTAAKDPLGRLIEDASGMRDKARAAQVEINQKLAESKAMSDQCAKLDTAMELLNLASTMLNFTDGIRAAIPNLLADKGIPAAFDETKASEGKKLLLGIGFKTAATFGMQSVSGLNNPGSFFIGMVVDAVNFGVKYHYDRQCTRFEGPFSGTLITQMKNEGVPYWKYTMQVKGKLTLSAPKGVAVALMKGRFEGLVTQYAVEQDVVNAFAPKLKSQLVYQQLVVPKLLGNLAAADELGTFYNQLVPNSFYLPVEAKREGSKLTLNIIEGGMVGMSSTYNYAQIFLVFMGGMIPELVHQMVPMQSPEFLMTRALKKDAVFEIKTVGDQQVFELPFNRVVEPDGDVKVTFHADVKACAPKCSKSSIGKVTDAIKQAVGK